MSNEAPERVWAWYYDGWHYTDDSSITSEAEYIRFDIAAAQTNKRVREYLEEVRSAVNECRLCTTRQSILSVINNQLDGL